MVPDKYMYLFGLRKDEALNSPFLDELRFSRG
jgi:hypothetical protein